jgi:hypothetical protein
MKGGIFNRPECCNQPCECPVCHEDKPLMRLNPCNHYVCLEDIQQIIQHNPRTPRCPICRALINNYGCNGNIINVPNNQPNIIPYDEGETDGEETDDDEIYGGKRKTNRTRKNNKKRKLNKRKKTNRRRKSSKRKTKGRSFYTSEHLK